MSQHGSKNRNRPARDFSLESRKPPGSPRSRTPRSGPGTPVIIGRHPVLEALKRGIVISLEISASAHGSAIHELEALACARAIPISRVSDLAFEGTGRTQGVLAAIRPVAARTDLIDFVSRLDLSLNPLLLMLDGIEDPHNFGAILRSAYASGTAGVIVRSRRQAPLNETVFKTSAGCAALIPIFEVTNLEQTIRTLKEENWWVLAAHRSPVAAEYHRTDWRRPIVLIVGAEGKGVSELLLKRSDEQVAISMRGEIDSLNVSVAAGILLLEAAHRRGHSPAGDFG